MGKGNGSTRASSSGSPRGISQNGTGGGTPSGFSARMSSKMSTEEENNIRDRIGDGFALPVYQFTAREYKEATGKELPEDAVQIVFGRGAANGTDYYRTLESPMYSNMKSEDVTLGKGYQAKDYTFLSGYNSLEQLQSFVKDVRAASWKTNYERLQRRWNHR